MKYHKIYENIIYHEWFTGLIEFSSWFIYDWIIWILSLINFIIPSLNYINKDSWNCQAWSSIHSYDWNLSVSWLLYCYYVFSLTLRGSEIIVKYWNWLRLVWDTNLPGLSAWQKENGTEIFTWKRKGERRNSLEKWINEKLFSKMKPTELQLNVYEKYWKRIKRKW